MNQILDVRGKQCPQPVIEAKKALKDTPGGILEVWVDNTMAVQNLMKLGNYHQISCTSEKLEEKFYKVFFHCGGQEVQPEEKEKPSEEISCIPDAKEGGTVVVISSELMGEGDPVLGKLLMKGFVYALTELERLPETILLYNGGARLSVEGSDSLEDLKTLEAEGVEILTCGTCLNHYGLTERLAVGQVTNMYQIAEKLSESRKIIRP